MKAITHKSGSITAECQALSSNSKHRKLFSTIITADDGDETVVTDSTSSKAKNF